MLVKQGSELCLQNIVLDSIAPDAGKIKGLVVYVTCSKAQLNVNGNLHGNNSEVVVGQRILELHVNRTHIQ